MRKEVLIKGEGWRVQVIKGEIPEICYFDAQGFLVCKIQVDQKTQRIDLTTFNPNNNYAITRNQTTGSQRLMI